MIETSVSGSSRREKHIELHDAILGMNRIINELDNLICRIEGPVPMAGDCEPPQDSSPNLIDILNGGGDLISDKTEAAYNRIMRLHELLF